MSEPSPPPAPPAALAGKAARGLARAKAVAPLAVAVGALGAAAALADAGGVTPRAASAEAALAAGLAAQGLGCLPEDVALVDPPAGLRGALVPARRAVVRVLRAGDAHADLVLVRFRSAPDGRPLALGAVHELGRTPDLDEGRPVRAGHRVAFVTTADGAVTSAGLLDLDGDPRAGSAPADLGRFERFQLAVTALQESGQSPRPHRTTVTLEPSAQAAALALDGERLRIAADGHALVLDARAGTLVEGDAHGRVAADALVRPASLVPWAVDRVRATGFGDERMQIVKAVAYTLKDRLERLLPEQGASATAADVQQDLGDVGSRPPATPETPELGWPPAPLVPVLPQPLPGEGAWISLEGDPFLPDFTGNPTPLVTSFVRTDPERKDARVYVTLWDPRVVELHMEAGTIEPVSATGETGHGEIPRDPDVLERVVGAFNGGFQATHGEYGMQAGGMLLLPPKPYAATVLELDDGRASFGTWPPGAPVPDNVVGFRQNMTALVEAGRYNPWGRTWWGGTPPGYADTIHTTRSGLCATNEGFVAYFFGHELAPDALGRGMLAARCRYGIHLDMNVGHVGFEYYRVARELPPLGRPLQKDWEAEGNVRDAPGLRFRARRMVRSTGHMSFPRYIGRDGRDFFYLLRRPLLPRSDGLAQGGYPSALAREANGVVRFEPRLVAAAEGREPRDGREPAPPLARLETRARAGAVVAPREVAVLLRDGVAFEGPLPAPAGAAVLLEGVGPASPWAARARLGACVDDRNGQVVVVEGEGLPARLKAAGCRKGVLATRDTTLALGASAGPATAPDDAGAPASVLRLVRSDRPALPSVLAETPFVPLAVWHPEMSKRPKLPPRSKPSAGAPAP